MGSGKEKAANRAVSRRILREALWDNSRIQIHVGKTQIWNRAGVVPRDFASCCVLPGWWDTRQTLVRGFGSTARGTWRPCVGGFPPSSRSCCARFAVCMGVALVLCFDLNKLYIPCVFSRLPLNRLRCSMNNNEWHCLCQLIGHLCHRPTWERGSLPVHTVLHMLHFGAVGPIAWRATSMWQTPWLLLCLTHQLQPLILLVLPTAVICLQMLVLKVLTGLLCCSDSVLPISTSVTLALQVMGGSSLPLSRWRFVSKKLSCGRASLPPSRRSQSGPMASLPFSWIPSSNLFVFTPEVFRVLLRLPVWPSTRRLGHHHAACSRAGVLARIRPWSSLLRFVVKLVVVVSMNVCRGQDGQSSP